VPIGGINNVVLGSENLGDRGINSLLQEPIVSRLHLINAAQSL
jgi:hypothetical protein